LGYSIVEADNLDDAIAIASGFCTTSRLKNSLELRPIVDLDSEALPVPPVRGGAGSRAQSAAGLLGAGRGGLGTAPITQSAGP
jgi:hypothetical protein